MTPPDERRMIRDAMDRLLTGNVLRSTGALTIVSLAQEAGVKRHLLTHRHTDLKDEFYAKVRAQGKVPQSEVALRDRVKAHDESLEELRTTVRQLRSENEALRRMNNVLAIEKAGAEEALKEVLGGGVTSIFRKGGGR